MNQILSSLNAAQAAINIAKNVLKELEVEQANLTKLIPGVYGKFMGDYLLGDDGQKYPIAANYASKSLLVYGDKLKMYEEGELKRFKQVEKVKRLKLDAILAKKEGKWHAVTADGSHRVLEAAVEHFGGMEGTLVEILVPEEDKFAPFAAIERATGGPTSKPIVEIKPEPVVAPIANLHLGESKPLAKELAVGQQGGGAQQPVAVQPVQEVKQVPQPASKPVPQNVVTKPLQVFKPNISNTPNSEQKKKKRNPVSTQNPQIVNKVAQQAVKLPSMAAAAPLGQVTSPVAVNPQAIVPEASRILTDEDLR